jgi:hypothetical protein
MKLCALPPAKALAKVPLLDLAFTSPTPVDAVARTAIRAAKGELSKCILDVDDILARPQQQWPSRRDR